MFRGRQSAVLVVVLMLAVGSAEARELGFSVEGRIGGDSNVLRSSFDKVEDAFFEISPRISVREKQREFQYNLVYLPTYATYAETSNVDGLDHVIMGDGRWRITPLDSVSFDLRHENIRRLRYDDTAPGFELDILEPSDRNRLRVTEATVGYSRQFTADWSGYLNVDVEDFDPAPDDRGAIADSRAYSARLGANHAFNANTSAGLSVSGRFRDTKVQLPDLDRPDLLLPNRPSSKTLIWDFSINLSRQLSETMSVSVQVGPSFISSKLVPDILLRGREESMFAGEAKTVYNQETSIFAAVTFQKTWQKARFSTAYVRSEFRGGFTASATISDDIDADFIYEFTRKIRVRASAGWNQRTQIIEIAGLNNVDTVQWRAVLTGSYRLTRQLQLISQYAFRKQDIKGNTNSTGVGDTHTGFLSLRYTFDPIIF